MQSTFIREEKNMGKASVEINKKCWVCKLVVKHEKEGCVYKECSKCGRRVVWFKDINRVRFSWLSGKTDLVKRTPKKGETHDMAK